MAVLGLNRRQGMAYVAFVLIAFVLQGPAILGGSLLGAASRTFLTIVGGYFVVLFFAILLEYLGGS